MEWFSVEDKLPEDQKSVLVRQLIGSKNCSVMFVGRYVREFQNEYTGEITEWADYNEELDEHFEPQGWYENQWNWDEYSGVWCEQEKVTHWMPLPEAPKAVT